MHWEVKTQLGRIFSELLDCFNICTKSIKPCARAFEAHVYEIFKMFDFTLSESGRLIWQGYTSIYAVIAIGKKMNDE